MRAITILLLPITLFVISHSTIYAAFGDPDLSFGIGGSKTDTALDYFPMAMARQTDGKIVVVGKRYDPYFHVVELVVRRYQPGGSVDSAFGSNGRAIPYQTGGWGMDVAIQSDGKIVVIGIAPPGDMTGGTTAVWRFRADGWYDSTFGSFGRVLTWGDGWCDVATLNVSGRIPTTEIIGACSQGEIFRLNTGGTPNQSFGTGGKIQAGGNLMAMALRAGKIYVTIGGTIRRYFTDGTTDTSFGNQGIFNDPADHICFSGYFIGSEYRSFGFQSDGTMLIAGSAEFLEGSRRHLSAHQTDGDFVPGFFAAPCPDLVGSSGAFPHLAVQTDNRIVIAFGNTVERRVANGVFESSYQVAVENTITDMLLLPDGKILTVSVVTPWGGPDQARLNLSLP